MANGQQTVSPAELNAEGLPEILKEPFSVPAARAFYSSHPASLEGTETRPDGLEDIEMAVVSDAAGKNINGREQDVTHALRFIRTREGREETDQDFVMIDHALAVKGLRWIRKNVKDKVIHRSAVEAKTDIDNHQMTLKPDNGSQNGDEPAISAPPRKSRRIREREDQQAKKAELQAEHETQRQAELERLAAWQEEHPPRGTNHFAEVMPTVKTGVNATGEIIIVEDDELKERVAKLQHEMTKDPVRIIDEIKDGEELRSFIDHEGLTILSKIFDRASQESQKSWADLAYTDPERLREVFGRWMSVFAGFSSEYKSLIRNKDGKLQQPNKIYPAIIAEKGRVNPMAYEAGTQSYGEQFLINSLITIGNTQPEEFRDMVYGIVEDSFKHEDRFTTEMALYLIAGSMGYSEPGNIVTLNTPIAKDLSETDKLKGVDLNLCLKELGYRPNIGRHSTRASRKLHRKYSDVELAAAILGLNTRDKDFEDKLYDLSSAPYIQAIKSGELPGSLYIRLKQQQTDLPEDA